ncbi:unnamed protein product [Eruca vesicaria subsp. sativa]|uniref:RHOMBOID-like protein n=1 Tax=Eruca vesicaria subsp. sativa TaxID=29727 RepID=A0ABC8IM68_ERUVS|nr:unnamed protein product [Eruca vesicaria subsp. sativa]
MALEIKVVDPPTNNPSAAQTSPANGRQRQQRTSFAEFRPFKLWFPWLVPAIVVANIALFLVSILEKMGALDVTINGGSKAPGVALVHLYMATCWCFSRPCQHVESYLHRHSSRARIWIRYGSLPFTFILQSSSSFDSWTVRIGLLYMISGFGGSLLSSLFNGDGISVGASGALFGLLGAMLSELLTNWTIYANKFAALLKLVFIIAINLAVGILPHVDNNFAHLGGFFSGFLLGFVFLIRPQYGYFNHRNNPRGYAAAPCAKSKHKPYQYVLWITSLLFLVAGYTVGLVLLLRGTDLNKHCSWCHYLTCMPTSLWNCNSQNVYCQLIKLRMIVELEQSSQIGKQMNLTCVANGRTEMYKLGNDNQSQIQLLCSQLCS